MALKPSLSNLEVRVSALEILVYKMIESLAVAKVAEKTADKALAMAQEALVVAAHCQQLLAPEHDAAGDHRHRRLQPLGPHDQTRCQAEDDG